jgi:hypothetical protein
LKGGSRYEVDRFGVDVLPKYFEIVPIVEAIHCGFKGRTPAGGRRTLPAVSAGAYLRSEAGVVVGGS